MSSPRRALPTALSLALLALAGCAGRADDPVQGLLSQSLKRGDRVLLARTLDPEGTRLAAVVVSSGGKPELRLYDHSQGKGYALVHTSQQGDSFHNLSLEDVDGDGQDEVVTLWEGGHLEVVEVLARGPGSAYQPILQNAGRQIEKRYDPAGLIQFWITSRTYAEGPGEAPAYATTVYRFEGGKFVESTLK